MAIKVLYCFLCFFFVVIFMLISQDPYLLDISLSDKEKPTIEFFNVRDYSLTQNGMDMKAKARRVQRFDSRDVLYDVDALMMEDDKLRTLQSNSATLNNSVIYLKGDVYYKENSTILTTQEVEYHQKEGKLIGTHPFTLEDKSVKAIGSSFIYDIKQGRIEAQNINATVQMEKK